MGETLGLVITWGSYVRLGRVGGLAKATGWEPSLSSLHVTGPVWADKQRWVTASLPWWVLPGRPCWERSEAYVALPSPTAQPAPAAGAWVSLAAGPAPPGRGLWAAQACWQPLLLISQGKHIPPCGEGHSGAEEEQPGQWGEVEVKPHPGCICCGRVSVPAQAPGADSWCFQVPLDGSAPPL